MKSKNIFLTLLSAAFVMTSCMDGNWGVPEYIKTNPPYGNNSIQFKTGSDVTTTAALKTKYSSVISGNTYQQITDDVQLQAIVNGNDQGGNIYKQISIQDATGGIIVGINATDQFSNMPVGQKILINLKGMYIGGYGKQAQLGTLYDGSIGRMDLTEWESKVRLLVVDSLAAKVTAVVDTVDFDSSLGVAALCGKVVKLSDVTISGDGTQTLAPDDESVTLIGNYAHRTINGAKGVTSSSGIVLRTSTYSDFAARKIPSGKVDLYGICTTYNGTWQILMRTNSDMKEK